MFSKRDFVKMFLKNTSAINGEWGDEQTTHLSKSLAIKLMQLLFKGSLHP